MRWLRLTLTKPCVWWSPAGLLFTIRSEDPVIEAGKSSAFFYLTLNYIVLYAINIRDRQVTTVFAGSYFEQLYLINNLATICAQLSMKLRLFIYYGVNFAMFNFKYYAQYRLFYIMHRKKWLEVHSWRFWHIITVFIRAMCFVTRLTHRVMTQCINS